MLQKNQLPLPGEQPNIAAGGVAIMPLAFGPRYGVVYAEVTVTKAAGGGGVYTWPVLADICHPTLPIFVKRGGKPLLQRLASELIADNLLKNASLAGSVSYYQGAGGAIPANFKSRVFNAAATAQPGGIAANTATTAVFQVPIYFGEYFRKDLPTAEGLMLPTAYIGGLFDKPFTVEVPIADNAGGALSGWGCKFWYDGDDMLWPLTNGQPTSPIVKRGRFTKAYAVAGDVSVAIPLKDRLMQFSLLLAAGDTWSKIHISKNGKAFKDLTPDRNAQVFFDHDMNTAGLAANRVDMVFDLNDDLNAAVPLTDTDTFEVTVTLSQVAAAAQMVVLVESFGLPD